MGFYGSPKTWIPYTKDCSQGFCSMYCPQWCNLMFSPPPPLEFPDDDNSGPNFSPLLVAIIGILASAFLLVSYYTIISKYCGNTNREVRDETRGSNEDQLDFAHNPTLHEPWHGTTNGLDEAVIKSITACKYKRGNGLVECTDCSVCLSEFQEDESLRLLPKCRHAFHLQCIDKWLRSHTNCPLCRASIISASAAPLPLPSTAANPLTNEAIPETSQVNDNNFETMIDEATQACDRAKNSIRAFSDLGNPQGRNSFFEIRDGRFQQVRRSISMDHCCQNHILIIDILRHDETEEIHEAESSGDVESSKHSVGSRQQIKSFT